MANWLSAIIDPLKAAGDTAKGLVEIRDTVKFGDAIIKLQAQIMSAQQGALAAHQREVSMAEEIRDLKSRMAQLEAWDTEKQRYALKQVGTGAFAYSPKPDMKASEPDHWLCTQCFGNRKKSFLQAKARTRREDHTTYHCSVCRGEISVHYSAAPGKNGNSRTVKV